MLRLRCCVLPQLLSSPSASPISQLRRLISTAAPAISPNPSFAVEDYLVATCGLSQAQALKASSKISHLKSPAKPDALLAFLARIGLSSAEVAVVVANDPMLLCGSVDRFLAPNVAALSGAGLSPSDIARLLSLGLRQFRCKDIVSALHYYLHFFGSSESLLRALKFGSLLASDLDRVVKPNVAFLHECGLRACDIPKLSLSSRWLLTINPQRLRAMVACAEGLGVPRASRMFRQVLQSVAFLSQKKIAAKVDFLKKTFRWSDAEVSIAVSKAPTVLARTKKSLKRTSRFLISEVGLEPGYIAHRPVIVNYSLDGRLRPRYYVVKFLKENGLLDFDRDYYSVVMVTEKVFVEKFICPHKEAAPHLAEDYNAACKGEVPTNFRFT